MCAILGIAALTDSFESSINWSRSFRKADFAESCEQNRVLFFFNTVIMQLKAEWIFKGNAEIQITSRNGLESGGCGAETWENSESGILVRLATVSGLYFKLTVS